MSTSQLSLPHEQTVTSNGCGFYVFMQGWACTSIPIIPLMEHVGSWFQFPKLHLERLAGPSSCLLANLNTGPTKIRSDHCQSETIRC